MSAIIKSDRGIECGICHGPFLDEKYRVTHVGGTSHDGFHRDCLLNWIKINPTCPFDRQPIDPDSFLSRTNRIVRRFRDASAAAVFTTLAGCVFCFGTLEKAEKDWATSRILLPISVANAGLIILGLAEGAIETRRWVMQNGIPANGIEVVVLATLVGASSLLGMANRILKTATMTAEILLRRNRSIFTGLGVFTGLFVKTAIDSGIQNMPLYPVIIGGAVAGALSLLQG